MAIPSSVTVNVLGYKGNNEVPVVVQLIDTSTLPTGMEVSQLLGVNAEPNFTVSVDNTFTTRSGVIEVPVLIDAKEQTLKFNYSLALSGTAGESATTYSVVPDVYAIARDVNTNNILTPSSITFRSYSKEGNSDKVAYTGWMNISVSVDGNTWTTVGSASSGTTKTYSNISPKLGNDYIQFIKCDLYNNSNHSTLLDTQTVPVISNGADGSDGINY